MLYVEIILVSLYSISLIELYQVLLLVHRWNDGSPSYLWTIPTVSIAALYFLFSSLEFYSRRFAFSLSKNKDWSLWKCNKSITHHQVKKPTSLLFFQARPESKQKQKAKLHLWPYSIIKFWTFVKGEQTLNFHHLVRKSRSNSTNCLAFFAMLHLDFHLVSIMHESHS